MLLLGGLLLVAWRHDVSGAALPVLSAFAKIPNALFAVIILGCGCWLIAADRPAMAQPERRSSQHRIKLAFSMAVAFALSLLPLALSNWWLLGVPRVTIYQRAVIGRTTTETFIFDNHICDFDQPFLHGLLRLLFDDTKGIVDTNRVLYTAIVGLLCSKVVRNRGLLLTALLIWLAQLVFYAKYDDRAASQQPVPDAAGLPGNARHRCSGRVRLAPAAERSSCGRGGLTGAR